MRCFAIGALAVALVAGTAGATTYVMSDENSTATVDTASGMYDWTVDGVRQLSLQTFAYKIGEGPVTTLDSLSCVAVLSNGDLDDGFERLAMRYTLAGQFQVDIDLTLQGGALGTDESLLTENITIKRLGTTNISWFKFFQYVDLDLGGTTTGDTVKILNGRVAQQSDGTAFVASETVVTNAPTRYEAGLFGTVWSHLTGGTLTNAAGPVSGDVAWAFEWDTTLVAGTDFQIGKAKHLGAAIPEPLTMLGVFAGVSGLGAYLRRRLAA